MVQVFELQEAGWGSRRPTRANSPLLLCSPAFLATSRVRSALQPTLRRPRRFVSWLSVSRADRDLFFQDPHVFSGAGCARTSARAFGLGMRGNGVSQRTAGRGDGAELRSPLARRAAVRHRRTGETRAPRPDLSNWMVGD